MFAGDLQVGRGNRVSGIGISVCFYLLFELVFQVPLLKVPLEHAFGIY